MKHTLTFNSNKSLVKLARDTMKASNFKVAYRDKYTPKKCFYLVKDDGIYLMNCYSNNPNKCELLNTTLSAMSAKGMVVGHTPHDNITGICKNKLYFADIGLSRSFSNDKVQLLHIKNGVAQIIK